MDLTRDNNPGGRPVLRVLLAAVITLTLAICMVGSVSAGAIPPLAFPGAEGFGAFTRGAFSGSPRPRIIFVTNLADSGPGSLRAALETSGPRIVIFKVGGLIQLESKLVISSPYLTLAGQTAPGDGIALAGHGLVVKTHDVIIRGIRVRPGDAGQIGTADNRDGISLERARSVIIDHSSFTWSVDEAFTLWYENRDITVQNCIIAEALNWSIHTKSNPKYASGKWPHSMGLLIGGPASNITVHQNLLASNRKRLPRVGGGTSLEFSNNVIYNWGLRASQFEDQEKRGPHRVDMIGNYYKAGPDTRQWTHAIDFDMWAGAQPAPGSLFYLEGNIDPHRTSNEQDEWDISTQRPGLEMYRTTERVVASAGVTMHTDAWQAYDHVLQYVGPRPLDAVDSRILRDVANGAGKLIDSPADVGGYPAYRGGEYPQDSSGTGIPDSWLLARGLDPADPNVAYQDRDGDGYTNIEEYINSLLPTEPLAIVSPKGSALRGEIPVELQAQLPSPLRSVRIELDGREIYAGASLPGNLTLQTGLLDEKTHRLHVVVVDSTGVRHARQTDFTVANVAVLSPLPDATLQGIVPVRLDTAVPEQHIAEIAVALRREKAAPALPPVLRLSMSPTVDIQLDSREVPDGRYVLSASVTTRSGATFAHSVPVAIDNWATITDELKPPQIISFFGSEEVIDHTKTYAESAGWRYDTSELGAFAGDPDRKACFTDNTAYLVWETPGLRTFQLVVFAKQELAAHAVSLAVSADGADWQEIGFSSQPADGAGDGWCKYVLTGELPINDTGFFRLQVNPTSPVTELQIGSATFVVKK